MKNFSKALALSLVVVCACSGLEQSLVYGDGKVHQVELPFPYKTLKDKDFEGGIKYIPEFFFTQLKDGEKCLLGPVDPCSIVILEQEGQDPLVFHKHPKANTIEDVIEKAKTKFDEKNYPDIVIRLITTFTPENRDEDEDNFFLEYGDLVGKKGLLHSKQALLKAFNIKNDHKHAVMSLFTNYDKEDLGEYLYAQKYYFVENKKGVVEVSSISPVREKIFGDFTSMNSLKEQVEGFFQECKRLTTKLFDTYYNSNKDLEFYKKNGYFEFKEI